MTGSGDSRSYQALRDRLIEIYQNVFADDLLPRTVVVVPSLSFDAEELAKIDGAHRYEERMLCMLLLLRMPRTQVIYVTSEAIDPSVIDYFLSLLAGVPFHHARERLRLFHCHDASNAALTEKILARPRLVKRIREAIDYPDAAHMMCFNATQLELDLARRLDIPLYAADPALGDLGTKSGSREVFRAAGIDFPDGAERLSTGEEVAAALADLRARNPDLDRAVVKLDEGFSGEGNALFAYRGDTDCDAIFDVLPERLEFEAAGEQWGRYVGKLEEMSGIVEAYIHGEDKRSPSVQCRIDPTGHPEIISTHDQVLGGPTGQIFLGATFPADAEYWIDLQNRGMKVAEVLADRGVIGRFGVDFVSVREDDGWKHYAIEINLRKGGTTHPFIMLQYLTDGRYDTETGLFRTASGDVRCYYATDNLHEERYRGLLPRDLIDIVVENRLHYHTASHRGTAFHLIGALSEFGKLGVVCIEDTVDEAKRLYERTVAMLDDAVDHATNGEDAEE
jgi:hypothetical protein